MKKIMEMLQNMKAKNEKKDNKGFSLVELIIVIAIMAILVGIVGTQVIPYINKSKEAKDLQIINSYGTAATTAYSSNAEKTTAATTIDVYGTNTDGADASGKINAPAKTLAEEIQSLTGYSSKGDLIKKMGSKKGGEIDKIVVVVNPTDKEVAAVDKKSPAAAAKTIVTQAYKADGTKIFDEVVTQL